MEAMTSSLRSGTVTQAAEWVNMPRLKAGMHVWPTPSRRAVSTQRQTWLS